MTTTTKRGRGRPHKKAAVKATQVYVALPQPAIEAVDREAEGHMVTRSEFLRRIIVEYFNQKVGEGKGGQGGVAGMGECERD